MSLRFTVMASGALLMGILFVAPVSDPCSAAPMIGPQSLRQDIIVRAAAVPNQVVRVRHQTNAALGIVLSVATRGSFAFDNRHVRLVLNHHLGSS